MSGPDPGGTGGTRTWRPRWAAVVPGAIAVAVVLAGVVAWATLPADVRAAFSWAQRGTSAVILAVIVVVLAGFARSRVSTDQDGLVLVNVLRTRHVPWWQIRGLRYRPDDPWPILLLVDDEQVGVMGIQSSDGRRARHDAGQLADVIAARTKVRPGG